MYTITCGEYPLLDLRAEKLMLINPKVNLEVNTAGSGSFKIYKSHPFYDKIEFLKSVIEVADEFGVLFRGRVTAEIDDFYGGKDVEMEGVMCFFNDSVVRPFSFPGDFVDDPDYISAAASGNVVEFFLRWLIDNHNSQVQDFQRFKIGTVTVSDKNNYITRADSSYTSTWNALKSKLFESALGGYLCIRYEDDGNYIDYVSKFEGTNSQVVRIGENLLDRQCEMDAAGTYSALLPLGAEVETEAEDGTVTKQTLTLESIEDGSITSDIEKRGDTVYSKSAVEKVGWIYAPISETKWTDVTEVGNLLEKSVEMLAQNTAVFVFTEELTAADLHFTDSEVQSLRIYRNVYAQIEAATELQLYQLRKLSVDILNPQNTKIQFGAVTETLTGRSDKYQSESIERIQSAESSITETREEMTEVKNQIVTERTEILNTCNEIILGALESYVETSNYEEFRETVETQLSILADEISMTFTTTTAHIDNVDGDMQAKFTELYKFIRFSEDGITIGDGESGITLSIDNDIISFEKNGQRFGWWDGTNFHTGNIYVDVDERAQFGNFAFIPRSDGSLSFLKVGG